MISLIFDPLGFVPPLLLDGKSILQELCRLDVSWMNQYLTILRSSGRRGKQTC